MQPRGLEAIDRDLDALDAHRGAVRAPMAIAHKLLLAAFYMLSTGESFRDLG